MLTIERRDKLKELILSRKTVTVLDMSKHFSVSTETIRRDFEALEQEGFLIKTYGGASLVQKKHSLISQKIKSELLVEEKLRMAKAAASLVRPNDCIFMDQSTSVLAMTDFLMDLPLTVVTNSLPVLQAFSAAPNIRLCATGGEFNVTTQAFLGSESAAYLQGHSLDLAFISCSSVDMENGISDSSNAVADFHRHVLQRSDAVCVIADHTKFDKTSFAKTCGLERLQFLMVDFCLSDAWRVRLRESGIEYRECLSIEGN